MSYYQLHGIESSYFYFIFYFYIIGFQFMASTSNDCTLYHQTKTSIGFWLQRELNPRSLIQLSETFLVELTRTHNNSF